MGQQSAGRNIEEQRRLIVSASHAPRHSKWQTDPNHNALMLHHGAHSPAVWAQSRTAQLHRPCALGLADQPEVAVLCSGALRVQEVAVQQACSDGLAHVQNAFGAGELFSSCLEDPLHEQVQDGVAAPVACGGWGCSGHHRVCVFSVGKE